MNSLGWRFYWAIRSWGFGIGAPIKLTSSALAANSVRDGQNGALFAGFLKITPVFLMVLPGVIGYVLMKKGAFALHNLGDTSTPDYNTMLPTLITHLVPVGLRACSPPAWPLH